MKTIVLFLTTTLVATTVLAQQVLKQQKVYGGANDDGVRAMCLTPAGGLIAGGYSSSPASGNKTAPNKGSYDMWIVKQDKAGNQQWDKAIGGNNFDILFSIKPTVDSGFILAGSSESSKSGNKSQNSRGYSDYWIVKINNNGKVLWDKTFGGGGYEEAKYIEQTTDRGFIVAGYSQSLISGDKTENSNGGFDLWVLKLNENGNLQWQRTLGGDRDEGYITGFPTSTRNLNQVVCKQTPDGGYLIGTSSASGISGDKTEDRMGYADFWIVKLDASGAKVWDKTIGGNNEDYLSTMELTADGGFIAGGYSNSPISGNKSESSKGDDDYWIVKLNSAGVIEWDKTIGGSKADILQAMKQTGDGGYILVGNSASGPSGDKTTGNKGNYDYWVVKTDNAGNVLWDKTIGGNGSDIAADVLEVAPGDYYLGGQSTSDISGNKTEASFGANDMWGIRLIDKMQESAGQTITAGSRLKADEAAANTAIFRVYPNPATTVLHIQNVGKAIFILSDQSGKKMLSKTLEGNADINVANISAGTYYLSNATTGATQKVVIAK